MLVATKGKPVPTARTTVTNRGAQIKGARENPSLNTPYITGKS